jgi:hypothetical protein
MRLPAEVVALDLSGPARACSEPIDGLIGADFFEGKVTRIDYTRGVLTREGGGAGGGGVRMRFANGVMCVPVAVNGGPARWTRVDTGCTDALDWCEAAGRVAAGARRTVGLAGPGRETLPAEVAVGSARLHDVPVKMLEREAFAGEAGLLGNAALSRYCVTIDGIGNRLLLGAAR